jgi:RarD protein
MVVGAASLWGTLSLFFRNAERLAAAEGATLSPATESFVFFGVVLVLLGPVSLRERPTAPPSRAAWLWLAFFSVADAGNVLLYFGAMQKTSVAVAVLSHYLAPVFVALLAPLVLSEPRRAGTWSAVGVALLGLVLLLGPTRDGGSAPILGATLGACSALLFAGAMMSMKRLGSWFTASQILCLHYPVALLIFFFFIPQGELASLGAKSWTLLILCGLIPGTAGGLLFVEGMRRLPASRAGILTLIEPLVAVLIGALAWHERPGLMAFFGGSIVLLAAHRVFAMGDK